MMLFRLAALAALCLSLCLAAAATAAPATENKTVGMDNAPVSGQRDREMLHGNVRTRIFHTPSCRYYECKDCTERFTSADLARIQGYRACEFCRE